MPARAVKLRRDLRTKFSSCPELARVQRPPFAMMEIGEIKKWRAHEEGGTLHCPPVRSGRPLTLRTESGWWEEHPTGGRQSRLRPFIETIHFSDYSKPKSFDLHGPMAGLDSVAEDSKRPWNIGD